MTPFCCTLCYAIPAITIENTVMLINASPIHREAHSLLEAVQRDGKINTQLHPVNDGANILLQSTTGVTAF